MDAVVNLNLSVVVCCCCCSTTSFLSFHFTYIIYLKLLQFDAANIIFKRSFAYFSEKKRTKNKKKETLQFSHRKNDHSFKNEWQFISWRLGIMRLLSICYRLLSIYDIVNYYQVVLYIRLSILVYVEGIPS